MRLSNHMHYMHLTLTRPIRCVFPGRSAFVAAVRESRNAHAEFHSRKQGLASILATGALDPNASPDVKEEIIRRTRVFYFNQCAPSLQFCEGLRMICCPRITGNSITIDEARDYERGDEGQPSASASNSAADDETRVLTFAELKELIESGKVDQIPNNKVIPEKINVRMPLHCIILGIC